MGDSLGIITPQRDGWKVMNVSFFNFDFNDAAAIGSCSDCAIKPIEYADHGMRTTDFEGLQFNDSSVPRRIRFRDPFNDLFHDIDSTLSDGGADSWVVSNFKHIESHPNCSQSLEVHDGLICDSSVNLRSFLFDKI